MKQHRYRITVEHLATAKGEPSPYPAPLQFEVGNHDDLFKIVDILRQRELFPATATADAFAIGLKLFGEVMLENRDHPLFAELRPQFVAFMKKLKRGP
ncbi:hypothetical protein CSC70_01855 [Pseudoxanthomonas kalamensis DSM 18571]|uniref:DUF3861 domain-containing protein n=1 Tax=Pseudoxanthomonas kalamensis TaxID=289483 RepID=UPI001391182B|nr:DUF3861 domain-containing protein [Pseudoxanthomonas kalamensis]KAF1712292.1 hypothetical protein CSC70_01855 [Pseudoxanthomonas kalamensis DSM 18571]